MVAACGYPSVIQKQVVLARFIHTLAKMQLGFPAAQLGFFCTACSKKLVSDRRYAINGSVDDRKGAYPLQARTLLILILVRILQTTLILENHIWELPVFPSQMHRLYIYVVLEI